LNLKGSHDVKYGNGNKLLQDEGKSFKEYGLQACTDSA